VDVESIAPVVTPFAHRTIYASLSLPLPLAGTPLSGTSYTWHLTTTPRGVYLPPILE